MGRILKTQEEAFCRSMAFEDISKAEACRKAGYGNSNSHASYFATQASRMMEKPEIVFRIQELRDEEAKKDIDLGNTIIQSLKKAAFRDGTKYMKVYQTQLENGRVAQDTVLAEKDFSKWSEEDKTLIDHFDSRTGNPVFIDKKWAIEKLMKLTGMGTDTGITIEDIKGLFCNAGLPTGTPEEVLSSLSDFDETDDTDEDE